MSLIFCYLFSASHICFLFHCWNFSELSERHITLSNQGLTWWEGSVLGRNAVSIHCYSRWRSSCGPAKSLVFPKAHPLWRTVNFILVPSSPVGTLKALLNLLGSAFGFGINSLSKKGAPLSDLTLLGFVRPWPSKPLCLGSFLMLLNRHSLDSV